jgi:RNA polymerase sigma-70 factor (ECF subfamily)
MGEAFQDEIVLVERAVAGDADAFGELYLQHLDTIYRYIYFRIAEPEEAQDLTEQVFLRAWEALPDYEREGRFTSWLYRIAHNMTVDYYRRRKPIVSTSLLESDVWESDAPVALDQVIRAEEATALASAIAQLPEDQQQVIVLRFVEGLRHAEVARIMDKSENACRAIQHRALKSLNRLLTGVREGV